MSYLKNTLNKNITPQNQPIPGTKQVQNSAGGYSFPVDNWTRLERFLVLGSEGGSYYATQQKLTAENAKAVQARPFSSLCRGLKSRLRKKSPPPGTTDFSRRRPTWYL